MKSLRSTVYAVHLVYYSDIVTTVLWVRSGFNADQGPGLVFHLNADLDSDPDTGSQIRADPRIRLRTVVKLCRHKELNFYMKYFM
jgi:hypothetical protein